MKRVTFCSIVLYCSFFLRDAESAEFFGLGDFLPNPIEGYVVVSGDGEMVLAGGLGTDSRYWTRETGLRRPLDDSMQSDETMDFAVLSRSGVVAGSVSPPLGSPNDDESTAIRWDRDNGIVSLGYLPGDDRSMATAISQDGNTVMGFSWRSNDDFRDRNNFVWNPDTGMQPVPDLDGMWVSLSDATGRFYGNSEEQGFEWTAETGVQLLDLPYRLRSVSSDGSTIVGGGWQANAYIWIRDIVTIDLGLAQLLPDSRQDSVAAGVSADGSRVVGWGAGLDSFLFTPEYGVTDLSRQIGLLTDANPNLKGWEISRAEDISDDGKVIVGRGRNPQGKSELWMLSLRDGILGDFDMSGAVTTSDIDLLHKALATDVWLGFDANMDGVVNMSDAVYWVQDLRNTWYGDANLDGEFNSGDLVDVFSAGEYEDAIEDNSGWAAGDWDGDGDFDSGDLVKAFQDGGYDAGPRIAAVPEPTSLFMLIAGLLGLSAIPRTRRPRV